METERMENKLLNRVELKFSIRHNGKATPSRKEVMDLIKKEEPKSNAEYIVIKYTNLISIFKPKDTILKYNQLSNTCRL